MDQQTLEVTVLSGSLGSGKTTLLLEWLSAAENADVGLIVNEVGDIDIDGALIMSQQGDHSIKLLPSGCVCCSIRDDLVAAVEELIDTKYRLDGTLLRKLIIETSGLAQPVSVVGSLLTPEMKKHGLSIQIVSTFDCQRGMALLQHDRQFQAQLAAAQRIVLTKRDLVADHEAATMVERLKGVNPLAEYIATPDRIEAVRQTFLPAQRIRADNFHALIALGAAGASHGDVQVTSYTLKDALPWQAFTERLDDLIATWGDRLLRAKFLLLVQGQTEPILLQSVGQRFSDPVVVPGLRLDASRLVFILQGVDLAHFDTEFNETIGVLPEPILS